MRWRWQAMVHHANARADALAPGYRCSHTPLSFLWIIFVPVETEEEGEVGKGSGEEVRSSNSNTNGKWHVHFHTPQIKLHAQPPKCAFCLSQFCIVIELDCPISHEIK